MASTSNATFLAGILVLAACGTGSTNLGELLSETADGSDGGSSSSSDATSASTSDTSLDGGSSGGELCGNGELDPGEPCDDGDALDGNGCNTDCVVSGTLLWSDIVDGPRGGSSDRAAAVAVAPDDTIFVVGTADGPEPAPAELWLRRYTGDGSALWTDVRSVDGDLHAADVQIPEPGTLVVGALHDDSTGERYPTLLGYTFDGDLDWELDYAEPYDQISLATIPGGLLAVATDAEQLVSLRRFDVDGMPLDTNTLPLMLVSTDVASFPDGGFAITGAVGTDVSVRRYTSEGDELWARMLEGHTGIAGVAVTPSERVAVVGYGIDYWVEGLDSDGGSRWSDSRTEPDGWFYAFDVAASPEGDVLVVGQRKRAADPDSGQLYVARYSSTGALLWEQAYAGPIQDEGGASAYGVAVDGAGNVIVVGSIDVGTGDQDFWILKLAP